MKETMLNRHCIVRCDRSGVFFGVLKHHKDSEAILADSRQLYWWEGAFTCNELALHGVKKPEKCQFPPPVEEMLLTDVIAIIPCTAEAIKSIKETPNHNHKY